MTFWGELRDGSQMLLGRADYAELKREENVPADLLKLRFPLSVPWPELARICAYREDRLIFSGVVDEQNTRLAENGLQTELVCRSTAALLLDNEAEPAMLENPSWRVMVRRYAEPLGFTAAGGEAPAIKGSFAVLKGESCWAALARYAERFLGGRLGVAEENRLVYQKTYQTAVLKGILSARQIYRPCKQISCVRVQDGTGAYASVYRNPKATVSRERFFSREDPRSPAEYVRLAEEDSRLWQVTLAGLPAAEPGDTVTAEIPLWDQTLTARVWKMRYVLEPAGEQTELYLK